MKYQCPNCSFAIFNRRIKKCESCGTTLPPELLYTDEQIASIDAEFERNKSRLAQLRRNLGLGGGADGGSTGGGDGCGGDGGGDCG
jgi:uncharacterized membrane protein